MPLLRVHVSDLNFTPPYSESPHVKPAHPITRREFIAGTSALLLAPDLPGQQTHSASPGTDLDKLALEGGEKAVKKAATGPVRWGEPEKGAIHRDAMAL